MKGRFLVASLGLVLAAGLGISAAFISSAPTKNSEQPRYGSPVSQQGLPTDQPLEEQPLPAPIVYTIKDYQGRIAVFAGESESPEYVFDAYTRHLPEYDREQILAGIRVEGKEAMMQLVEDYIS